MACDLHSQANPSCQFTHPLRMPSKKQSAAAKRNIKKAARAAKAKRTVAHLPKATRTALGKKGAKAAKRKRSKK
jgi:hypothetical protein